MTKKAVVILLVFSTFWMPLKADWKADLLSYLGPEPDYPAALKFLGAKLEDMNDPDRQTAIALLAFFSRKVSQKDDERTRIVQYFETYRDNDPDFSFLDYKTHRDFLDFWISWKSTYPLITSLDLLQYNEVGPTLPAVLDVGLDLMNSAYYKISLGSRVLGGGHWPKGFHILRLPVSDLFTESGAYEFTLDLKTKDFVLRKPIRIDIEIRSTEPIRASSSADGGPATRPPIPARTPEGEISLYIGDELILSSKKIPPYTAPLKIPLPGPSMTGQKPYMPTPRADDPSVISGVSILDALAVAIKTIKDLAKKKPAQPVPPSYKKVTFMDFAFIRLTNDGTPTDARAEVRLRPSPRAVILNP